MRRVNLTVSMCQAVYFEYLILIHLIMYKFCDSFIKSVIDGAPSRGCEYFQSNKQKQNIQMKEVTPNG